MKLRAFLLLVSAVVVLYFSTAAYVFHFEIDRLLFPSTAAADKPTGSITPQITGPTDNVMLIRRYGVPQLGCVVFFPGQDDAPGRSGLREVQNLTLQALSIVGQTCPPERPVFVGRSRWYLSPIAQLPVSRLLSHDNSLTEALSVSPPFPEALRAVGAIPSSARLVAVEGGMHSNAYFLVLDVYVQSVLDMLLTASTLAARI